jgi:glycosyltransferase involved in cell wall biosynthesis
VPLRIGVDLNPLRPPYTGVGNYELWLLDALLALGDDVAFEGFRRLDWVTVDRDYLAACRAAAAKDGGTAPSAPSSPARGALRRVERFVRGATRVHAATAALRGAAYARSVGRRRLDAFHAFMYRAPAVVPAVPVIPVVYDLSHIRYPEFHPASRVRWMAPVADACHAAPAVHTISAFTAGEIAREFGVAPARIHVVPPAVSAVFRDPARADDGALRRLGLDRDGFALTVSTLEPRKNLATLLDAYGRLPAAAQARLPLVVVGAAGWGDVRLADHPLVRAGAVRPAGYVSDAELAGLYRAARVMLYPSIYEGYGMPVIEALAAGAPVVASDAASMPEALAGAGRLVAPRDVDGWTAALRAALDRPRAGSGPAAPPPAWTWADAARRTRAIYDALGRETGMSG